MPFQFQQFSDYGTSNPILARVFFQWGDILKFHRLPKERTDLVLTILHNDVVPRLIECERIAAAFTSDVEKGFAEGIKPQGKALGLPSILRLKNRAEDFLYGAQMALRDYSGIFEPLLGKAVPKGNVGVLLKWAEKKLSKDDIFTRTLRSHHDDWIQYLVDMREVVTHPSSPKGPLGIYNFEVDATDQLIPPTWKLGAKHRAAITMEMDVLNGNLLRFCEEALYYALWQLPAPPIGRVVEIPEAERDPANPIRFRIGL